MKNSTLLLGAALGLGVGAAVVGCATQQKATQTPPSAAGSVLSETPPTPSQTGDLAAAAGFSAKPGDPLESPTMPPPQAFPIASMTRFSLRNGLRVVVVLSRDLPTVDLILTVRAGNVDEPAGMTGLSTFVISMLRQGTASRTADEISEKIDAAGAELATHTLEEHTAIHCSGLSKSLKLCLDLLADMSQHPSFPESEMGEVLDQIIATIEQVRDDKDTLSEWHFANQLYGDNHPLGRIATSEEITRIKRSDLQAFHAKHFVPSNAILTIAGNVEPAKIRRQIEHVFSGWKGRPAPERKEPGLDSANSKGIHVVLVDKPDLEQTRILIGHAGMRRKDADYDAAELANYTLGGGSFSSRLMDRLRAKGGKTYGIRSGFESSSWVSAFSVDVDVPHAHVASTISEILEEMRKMKAAGPTPAELLAAKTHIAWGYPLDLQTPAEVASALVSSELLDLPGDYVETAPLRINAISLAQVKAAAKNRLSPDNLIVVLVGNAAVVGPALDKMNLSYERISYLDPISTSVRKANKMKP